MPTQDRKRRQSSGSRPPTGLAKLPPPSFLPLAATSPARVGNGIPGCHSCCVRGKFSKLSSCLIRPPGHPPASSEGPGSLGAPLLDPPVLERPLLPLPLFPGHQAWATPSRPALACIRAATVAATGRLLSLAPVAATPTCPHPPQPCPALIPGPPSHSGSRPLWRDVFALTSTASSSKAHRSHMGTPARCHGG